MYCETELIDLLPMQNGPLCSHIHSSGNTIGPLHPDDLKGLREWVCAKQVGKIKTGNNCKGMYSAPWRVG